MLTEQQIRDFKKQTDMYGAGKNPHLQTGDEADSYRYTTEATQPSEKLPERYLAKSSNSLFYRINWINIGILVIVSVLIIVLLLYLYKKINNKKSNNVLSKYNSVPKVTVNGKEEISVDIKNFHFCPFCGNELKDSFAFCPYCGKQLYDSLNHDNQLLTSINTIKKKIEVIKDKVSVSENPISVNDHAPVADEKKDKLRNVTYAKLISFDGLFNFHGRRGREDYFKVLILTFVLAKLIPFFGGVISAYIGLVNNIKRVHDINRSAFVAVGISLFSNICALITMSLLPVSQEHAIRLRQAGLLGKHGIYIIVVLGLLAILPCLYLTFKDGDVGDNQYGPNPLKR